MVEGGGGDDVLCGGRSADKLYGGPGDDIIYGEEENDTIFPGAGDDKVLGSARRRPDLRLRRGGREIIDDGIDILNGGWNDDVSSPAAPTRCSASRTTTPSARRPR